MSTSPNLGLDLQTTGSNNGTWGVTLNTNQSIIDSRFGGRVSVDCAGNSNISVSASEAQNFYQTLTGVLTGNIKYILPAIGGFFNIKNSTTGSFTVTVVNTALGTGVVLSQGDSQLLFSNPDTTAVSSTLPTSLSLSSLSVSGQITSTIATGNAPFVVASTTPVANLSIGGNAATASLASSVTTNANLTGMVTSVGNATTVVTNANLTGPITSTGNAISALTAHNVLIGNGSGAIAYAAPGTAGQALLSNGASSNPSFGTIFSVLSSSIANPGYVQLSNGLVLQWGNVTAGLSNPTIVTFPLQFPNAVFSTVATYNDSGHVSTTIGIDTVTTSTMTVHKPSASSNPFFWFAVGN